MTFLNPILVFYGQYPWNHELFSLFMYYFSLKMFWNFDRLYSITREKIAFLFILYRRMRCLRVKIISQVAIDFYSFVVDRRNGQLLYIESISLPGRTPYEDYK